MDLLWWINAFSCNEWVSGSADCLHDSIGRMDTIELATYESEWWYFTLLCFVLGIMARSWVNISSPLLTSNSLHRKVGETVPKLYPRVFIYFMRSMIGMVLLSAWLIAMYSLSVEPRYIAVWSCYFNITGYSKYDTTNTKRKHSVYKLSLASSGNQLPLKSLSAHTLTSLSWGRINITILLVTFKYRPIFLIS